ncbi:MAG: aquaporin [Planctomycetes bacterium]|nr:aquaporin [Planctomycetota bacterium]
MPSRDTEAQSALLWLRSASRNVATLVQTAAIGGFGIGLTVATDILCFGPLTGASMNPARSLGPALIAGAWDFHWVYWAGPILGALAAAFVYHGVFGSEENK